MGASETCNHPNFRGKTRSEEEEEEEESKGE